MVYHAGMYQYAYMRSSSTAYHSCDDRRYVCFTPPILHDFVCTWGFLAQDFIGSIETVRLARGFLFPIVGVRLRVVDPLRSATIQFTTALDEVRGSSYPQRPLERKVPASPAELFGILMIPPTEYRTVPLQVWLC